MKKKKLKIAALTTVALLTVAAVGVTIAGLSDNTKELTNSFKPGKIETSIDEEGEGTVKKSRIKNVGSLACLVRARVTISPYRAAEAIDLTAKGDGWDWSQWSDGDGFVYYTKVLPAGESSYTSYLFEGIKLKNGLDWKTFGLENFDVSVYEESIQVEAYNGNEMITALDEHGDYDAAKAAAVWELYEPSDEK